MHSLGMICTTNSFNDYCDGCLWVKRASSRLEESHSGEQWFYLHKLDLERWRGHAAPQSAATNELISIRYQWLSARLWYLQCVSTGDTTGLAQRHKDVNQTLISNWNQFKDYCRLGNHTMSSDWTGAVGTVSLNIHNSPLKLTTLLISLFLTPTRPKLSKWPLD